jgi:predicted YcjX-like family ATPase
MNPGGGTDTPDREERSTLISMRDKDSIAAFDRLNSVAAKLYASWPIWQNNLLPLFKAANIDPATVAYIHAVPFRVADNVSLAGIYASAWAEVSSRQAALLQPGRILLAGATAGGKIQRFMPVKSRIVMRSIGDKQHADRSTKIAASHAAILGDRAFWQ